MKAASCASVRPHSVFEETLNVSCDMGIMVVSVHAATDINNAANKLILNFTTTASYYFQIERKYIYSSVCWKSKAIPKNGLVVGDATTRRMHGLHAPLNTFALTSLRGQSTPCIPAKSNRKPLFHSLFTSIFFAFFNASGSFGKVIVRTPFLNEAATLLVSTSSGMDIERLKDP